MSEEQIEQVIPDVVQETVMEDPSQLVDSTTTLEYGAITEGTNKRQATVHFSQQYTGPIPPASELRAYNEIQDDLVNRVVTMAEQQQAHRIAMEVEASNRDNIRLESKNKLDNRVVDINSRNYIIGSFLMGLLAILGFILAIMGRTPESVAAFLAPVLSGIVNIFKPLLSKQ